jgi:hypothetical protein
LFAIAITVTSELWNFEDIDNCGKKDRNLVFIMEKSSSLLGKCVMVEVYFKRLIVFLAGADLI